MFYLYCFVCLCLFCFCLFDSFFVWFLFLGFVCLFILFVLFIVCCCCFCCSLFCFVYLFGLVWFAFFAVCLFVAVSVIWLILKKSHLFLLLPSPFLPTHPAYFFSFFLPSFHTTGSSPTPTLKQKTSSMCPMKWKIRAIKVSWRSLCCMLFQ